MICLVRLIVAAVCGLLIGVERQTRMKGAGSRTHMMVSLGAALMTLVSSYGFLLIAMPRHFDKADFLRLQVDIPGVQSVEI